MTRWFYFSLLLTAISWVGVFGFFHSHFHELREKIPIHWNLEMEPDGFVPRDKALPYLLLFPAVMTGILLLTPLLPWLSPRGFQVEGFRSVYEYVMALVVMLFAWLLVLQLWASLGDHPWFGRWFVAGFFVFFALLGGVLGKVQRNFWMGIRTPWTLASEAVWNKTHHLAGWLWLAMGILGAVGTLAGVPLSLCFGLLVVAVLVPVIYSLVEYKRLEGQGNGSSPN